MANYFYSVVKFVPDPVRGEQLNVGVAVVSDDGNYFSARFLPPNQTGRLRRISSIDDFRFIRDLASEMRDVQAPRLLGNAPGAVWSLDALRHASREWANTIQFSEPRAAIHERGDALLETLYARYVADPRPRRARARDRRWVRRRVQTVLVGALATARPEVAAGEVLHRDFEITGGIERHTFDYGLMNGDLRQLVHTLSLEGIDKAAIRNEVDAVAWAIDDVRKLSETPISVVTIGSGALLDRAERLYGDLAANLVRENAMDDWANVVAVDLAAASHG
jgi:hypothetical protein